MQTLRLSKNFTLKELTVSATGARKGISNEPNSVIVKHLQRLVDELLQPVRDLLRQPIVVYSGYRSVAVNNAVGGSKTSAHMQGFAVDFACPGYGSPREVAAFLAKELKALNIKFDQIILEFDQWVHIGLCTQTGEQRGEVLTAKKVKGQTIYKKGIV